MCVFILFWDLNSLRIKSLYTMNRKKTIQSKERHFNTSYPAIGYWISIKREKERDKKNRRQWNLSLHLQQTDQSNESSIYIDFIIGGPLQNQTLYEKKQNLFFLRELKIDAFRLNGSTFEFYISSCWRTAFQKLQFWSRVMDWN